MNRIAFRVDEKNGQFLTATILSSHHHRHAPLGMLDWCIIGFFLLAGAGLAGLLLTH